MRSLFAVLLLAVTPVTAQVVGQNQQPGGGGAYTVSVTSKLVIEAVNIKDKQGKSITGLTAKDFTVTEDGVAQTVKICEYQELPVAPDAPATKPARENITLYNRLAITQIAPGGAA